MAETAVDLMAFATALFAAAMMWSGKGDSFTESWPWVFIVLILIPVTVHLLAGDLRAPWYAWRQTLYFSAAWLVFMMARENATKLMASVFFTGILTATAYIYLAYALIQAYDVRFFTAYEDTHLFPVWTNLVTRFPGPLQQPDWQGVFLVLVVCSQLFQGLLNRGRTRMWSALAILPFLGLLLTSSRSALLVSILGIGAMLYLSKLDRQFLIAVGGMITVAVILTIVINYTVPPVHETQNIVARFGSGGYKDRLLIWDTCIHLAFTHPLLGVGWGNLPAYGIDGMVNVVLHHHSLGKAATSLVGGNAWAHNIMLQGWVEGGIFGLLAAIMLCIAVFKQWLALYPVHLVTLDGRVLGGVFAGILLAHGMISVSIMQPYFMSLLALSLAATFPKSTNEEIKA